MKKVLSFKKLIMSMLIVSLLVSIPQMSEAAQISSIPDGAVINPQTNNAFHEDQIGVSLSSLEIVDALNAKKPIYFKLPGSAIFVNITNGSMVQSSVIEQLPSLKYTDKKGNVSTIPGYQPEDFEVTEIN
ncbi:hypothetical protein [Sporosarcina obsidiansis]|uniref:hypothetical protein n=1 Tax=Sporosarcina obsidiansis TaxID=2660748 RepID=UPI00129B810B|nr:hypothetical protein [Sporosarcina obsidiansis]